MLQTIFIHLYTSFPLTNQTVLTRGIESRPLVRQIRLARNLLLTRTKTHRPSRSFRFLNRQNTGSSEHDIRKRIAIACMQLYGFPRSYNMWHYRVFTRNAGIGKCVIYDANTTGQTHPNSSRVVEWGSCFYSIENGRKDEDSIEPYNSPLGYIRGIQY